MEQKQFRIIAAWQDGRSGGKKQGKRSKGKRSGNKKQHKERIINTTREPFVTASTSQEGTMC